ncbi:hypothetical protein PMAYCL1PPCAC_13346 [Pristionchus mayeri]|uniref:Uncharacterized protein n=1 Tax=Pristionchus mayeri TaxID=1317129 RepID=A0AAN4ZQD1_9BILA|nr:hypothetical protein PMAYCL1PPCAC_13346 [Pristionchus mayeri]
MLPSSRPPLTEEQKARIAANRAKAIEKQALTADEKARIAANRARAIQLQALKASGGATGSGESATAATVPIAVSRPPQPPPAAAATISAPSATFAAAAARPVQQQALPVRSASLNDAPQQSMPAPIRTYTGPLTAEQEAQRLKNRQEAMAKQVAARAADEAKKAAAAGAAVPPPTTGYSSHSSLGMGAAHSSVSTTLNMTAAPPVVPAAAPPPTVIAPKIPFMRSNVQAEFSVHSVDRFRVTLTPYLRSITDALRTVPSRIWDDKTRSNTFLFSDLNTVYSVLSRIEDANVHVIRLPENVVRILTKKDKGGREKTHINPTGDLTSGIDPGLLSKLFPYQRKGVEFGIRKGGRCMIADEMGLGKSIQALAIARYYRADFPLAIVCPASVKSAWKGQIERFCPAINENLYIMEKEKEPLPGVSTSNTVIIMSYDFLGKRMDDLTKAGYGVWIFDESHYLKDIKSKRTKASVAVTKKANRVILLSGTPALSRPAELFTQIRLIDPYLFTSQKDFQIRYCDGQETNWGFQAKGATNSEELSMILQNRLMIRRLKSEVLTELPSKIREVIYLKSGDISSRIDKTRLTSSRAFDKGTFNPNDESLLEYYSHTGTAKARPVCDHIMDNFFYEGSDDSRKILVFAHHTIVLDTIEHCLSIREIKSIRIDGKVPASKRGELCKAFQEDPSVRVAVLSITAAGQGITLTAASVVIFAEIHWVPGNMQQAEDRAHRVGQKDSVFVQYMLAKNTADDLIWPLVLNKIDILEQVNLNAEKFTNTERKEIDTDNVEYFIDENDDDVQPTTSKKRKF